MKFLCALSVFFVAGVLLLSCGGDKERIVAEVAGRKITAVDVERASAKLPKLREQGVEPIVNALVNKALLVVEAESRGLDQDSVVVEKVERLAFRKMMEVFRKKIWERVEASEEEMRTRFVEMGLDTLSKWRTRHIVVKTRPEAEEALEALEEGTDFAQLARERSIDEKSAKEGGDLGWWQKRDMTGPTAEQVFSMRAGEISEPFESSWGWHIFEVLEKRPLEFETHRVRLEEQVRSQKAKREEKAFLEQLRETLKFQRVESSVNLLLEKGRDCRENLPDLPEEALDEPLLTYEGEAVTLGDYIAQVKKMQPKHRPVAGDSVKVARAVDWIARTQVLMPAAFREMGIADSPEVLEYVRRGRDEAMVEELRRLEVEDRVLTWEVIQKYYEDHLEYYFEESKIIAHGALLESAEESQDLLSEARKGENIAKAARKYASRLNSGEYLFRASEKQQWGISHYYPLIEKAEIGQLVGPIELTWEDLNGKLQKGYALFGIVKREKERYKRLDEVEESVRNELRRKRAEEIEMLFGNFLETLRAKYADQIVVHKEVLTDLEASSEASVSPK